MWYRRVSFDGIISEVKILRYCLVCPQSRFLGIADMFFITNRLLLTMCVSYSRHVLLLLFSACSATFLSWAENCQPTIGTRRGWRMAACPGWNAEKRCAVQTSWAFMRVLFSGTHVPNEWIVSGERTVKNLYIVFSRNRNRESMLPLSCARFMLYRQLYVWNNIPQYSYFIPCFCFFLLIRHLFSFLQDTLSYSGKACLRLSYMPFGMSIWAFPHDGKAFSARRKKAYMLAMCAMCQYSTDYADGRNHA